MNSGVLGGFIGILIGIGGGIIGCYYSIKNTNGPKERKFMIKFVIVVAVIVTALLGVVFSVGYPAAFWVMAPFFGIVLPAMIYFANRKQKEIRVDESTQQ